MATYESVKYAHSGAGLTGIAATAVADGSVTNAEYQFINTLASNAQTQISANLPKAGGTMTGGIVFPDDTGPAPAKISMGAGNDIKVYSNGSSGLIVGNALEIQSTTAEKYLTATADGAVDVYHDNVKKFETSATGVTVSGTAVATTFSGSGASLTSLPAANLSGTAAAINGSNITNLNASNLASGTVPDARLPASALSSDYVKLSRVTGNGVASIGFLGAPSGFSGDYRHYKVILDGKWQNANNASTYIAMRISDNSSGYSSSSIYYSSQIFGMTNANNWTYTTGGSLYYANRWPPYANQGSRSAACEITIFGANESCHKTVASLGGSFDRNQNGASWQSSGGVIETTGTITGVQLFMADGANITGPSGATLYGIK